MRIAYIGYSKNTNRETGALKKMAAQSRAWIKRGHDVHLFLFSPYSGVWSGLSDLQVSSEEHVRLWNLLSKTSRLVDEVIRYRPDVVYLRFGTYYPAFERLFRKAPVIVEINTDDVAEYRLTLSWPTYAYHRLGRSRLFNASSGLVCVTHELARKTASFGKPFLVTGNGIQLDSLDVIPSPAHDAPRLFFIGTPGQDWHGVDKINDMAGCFPEWCFDVVGYTPEQFGATAHANVSFHGYLGREQYRELLAEADVAIGTLGLYRKGMDEACPLKVREYLACGIPTIIAYEETDFPGGAPFLLRLPNEDFAMTEHKSEIADFVGHWRGKRVDRQAIAGLDSAGKEGERIRFFESVRSDWGGNKARDGNG